MSPSRRPNWETFIVRMWREQVNGAWRGEIIHSASHASAYFATLEQIDTFIRRFAEGIENQTDLRTEEKHDEKTD